MSNMSYVRFQNTLIDLRDCAEHLADELSAEEARARDRLVKLCREIAGHDDDRTTTDDMRPMLEIIGNAAVLFANAKEQVAQLQAENAALRAKIGAAVEAVQAVESPAQPTPQIEYIELDGIGHIVWWEGPGVYAGPHVKGPTNLRRVKAGRQPAQWVVRVYDKRPQGRVIQQPE